MDWWTCHPYRPEMNVLAPYACLLQPVLPAPCGTSVRDGRHRWTASPGYRRYECETLQAFHGSPSGWQNSWLVAGFHVLMHDFSPPKQAGRDRQKWAENGVLCLLGPFLAFEKSSPWTQNS